LRPQAPSASSCSCSLPAPFLVSIEKIEEVCGVDWKMERLTFETRNLERNVVLSEKFVSQLFNILISRLNRERPPL
jgi:hypothetical protein